MKFEPVEPSHFVRTVISTIPGTNTTVIGHLIQPLCAMCGSCNRADSLTWCIITMLTHNGLKGHFRIFRSFFQSLQVFCRCIWTEIPVDPDPVHFPAVQHFLLPYDRHIIFNLACYRACCTTCTWIQVDHHSPMMIWIFMSFPER